MRQVLDIFITTSYVPYANSLKDIRRTIESLLRIVDLRNRSISFKIFIVLDFYQPGSSPKIIRGYRHYRKKLKEDFSNIELIALESWSHLSGAICHAVSNFAKAPYLLIVQDDLEFLQDVSLTRIMKVLDHNSDVKHVRFNKRRNIKAGLDTSLCEKQFDELFLVKTNNWSDNNYLTTLQHFVSDISPIICDTRTFPENELRKWNILDPERFGTYLYGRLEEGPFIKHLGEVKGRARARLNSWKRPHNIALFGRIVYFAIATYSYIRRRGQA
jgi:hypothetical protein